MGTYVYGDNYLWRNYKKMKLRDLRTGKYVDKNQVEKKLGIYIEYVYEVGIREPIMLSISNDFLLNNGIRWEDKYVRIKGRGNQENHLEW